MAGNRGEEVGMRNLPKVGDRVTIPWGRHDVDGDVIAVYTTGYAPRARVSVFIEGNAEPMTVTFPIEWMEPAQVA
jgi:hypothetical protein